MDVSNFPPEMRLLEKREFDSVFNHTAHRLTAPGILILAKNNALPCSRLGMIISKRTTPHAVKRNRIKRLVRESFRNGPIRAVGLDIVVLLRSQINGRTKADIRSSIDDLFGQLTSKGGGS